jgi:hypothetical protein
VAVGRGRRVGWSDENIEGNEQRTPFDRDNLNRSLAALTKGRHSIDQAGRVGRCSTVTSTGVHTMPGTLRSGA